MTLLKQILTELPFSRSELSELITTAQHRYKVYEIPKRKPGKFRIIAQPSPEVKLLQTWIVDKVFNEFSIHKAAMAYRKGVSTYSHANLHAKSRFLLKMDFEDFFTSITYEDVFKYLTKIGNFSSQDARLVCLIVCWRDKRNFSLCLSMGAPSSPTVSNLIMYEFDKKVVKFCHSLNVKYSRYADDLAFSTNEKNVLQLVQSEIPLILNEIEYPNLSLNVDKTVSTSKAFRRNLVGLVLTPEGKVSIGRERKRLIRSKLFRYCNNELSNQEIATLRGELAYIWSVEKSYIFSLITKFSSRPFDKLELPFGQYYDNDL